MATLQVISSGALGRGLGTRGGVGTGDGRRGCGAGSCETCAFLLAPEGVMSVGFADAAARGLRLRLWERLSRVGFGTGYRHRGCGVGSRETGTFRLTPALFAVAGSFALAGAARGLWLRLER